MNRILFGALAALSLAAAGLFWWQGRAETETGKAPPTLPAAAGPGAEALPVANIDGLQGDAPPQADEASREKLRFARVDRDRDGRITRNEMLAPRAAAFRKLDRDGNNLLTFEEWAVRTSGRFAVADLNRDGALSAGEFATTKPKRKPQPKFRCAPPSVKAAGKAAGKQRAARSDDDESDPEDAEPAG